MHLGLLRLGTYGSLQRFGLEQHGRVDGDFRPQRLVGPGASSWTNNIHMTGPITLATEAAELVSWKNKLATNHVTIGPPGAGLGTHGRDAGEPQSSAGFEHSVLATAPRSIFLYVSALSMSI